jgi:hypothetical protein
LVSSFIGLIVACFGGKKEQAFAFFPIEGEAAGKLAPQAARIWE